MLNFFCKAVFQSIAIGILLCVSACTAMHVHTSVPNDEKDYHNFYDDQTLDLNASTVLLPYNRIVDPAGTVVRFGTPSQENHSLDCVLLPGGKVLAVEDRYGLALFAVEEKRLLFHVNYEGGYNGLKSTFSGLAVWEAGGETHIFWGAANPISKTSYIMEAVWNGQNATMQSAILIPAKAPAPMALPNALAVSKEAGDAYLYVVLNGNNELAKIRLKDRQPVWTTPTGMAPYGIALTASKAYVTNWAGAMPTAAAKETAGIPYGKVSVDPRTGATASGTVSVIDLQTGKTEAEIAVGLHPSAIVGSPQQQYLYVANANSDNVSIIHTATNKVVDSISVKLNKEADYVGDSPNALALAKNGDTLYVSNGMDNAVAVVKLGSRVSEGGSGPSAVTGFIPTEAYPAGLALDNETLYVCNLEGEGARVLSKNGGANCHNQEATISIIPLPQPTRLQAYTKRVEAANLAFRTSLSQLLPRKEAAPRPVPQRIGEPSVFKHVLYIIKENKTYDQVLGDMPEGNGMKSLCIFGNDITPNEHKLAKEYLLLDNFYASGKSSAEGHSWTDAAMVTDYVEKNVNAWFRSYPHVLADALVYNKAGFLWNNALDHGKTVRIYGEACSPTWKGNLSWKDIYQLYRENKPFAFTNTTTISRVEPVLSPTFPCFENQRVNDQLRADAFIKELKAYEALPGDQLPQLMIMALPADHTAGMREGFPTPRAMVADNDLALGRIMEALTQSRFWDSTVVFVTQDDPQSGWDHVSAYRTTGFVISPYSVLGKAVHTNYNQTSMVRTIEQILAIPPMNVMDATALPMFDCFSSTPQKKAFAHVNNNIPLDEMNQPATTLRGKAKKYARLSALPMFEHIDGGDDELLNRIVWYSVKGGKPYPQRMTLPKAQREEDDDDDESR